jgi:uncharacterized protein YraI
MLRYMVAALAVIGAWVIPATAEAASDGYTTADVNMRAGPSTEYPRILVLPYGSPVVVYGCVRGYTWCDVSAYRERGWVSSRYLDIFYDDRRTYVPYRPRVQVPIITFDFGYWDTWYPRYPWYRDYRWRQSYPNPDWYRERRRNDDGNVFYPNDERRVRRDGGFERNERIERRQDGDVRVIRPQRRELDRSEAIAPRERLRVREVERDRGAERRIERQQRQSEKRRDQAERKQRRDEVRGGNRSERNDRGRGNGRASECVMRNGRCVVVD